MARYQHFRSEPNFFQTEPSRQKRLPHKKQSPQSRKFAFQVEEGAEDTHQIERKRGREERREKKEREGTGKEDTRKMPSDETQMSKVTQHMTTLVSPGKEPGG